MKKLKILYMLFLCVSYVFTPETGKAAKIEIQESSVKSGEEIHVKLISDPDMPFNGNVEIFKDLTADDINNNYWPEDNKVGSLIIKYEQDKVETGTLFNVTKDTLNYPPGHYYFKALFNNKTEFVFDDIQILPMADDISNIIRQNMIYNNLIYAIYANDGTLIRSNLYDPVYPVVYPDEILVLALNLNIFNKFKNEVTVSYKSADGLHYMDRMQSLKVIREMNAVDTIIISPECGTPNLSASDYPDGIALIYHRTPSHLKYYENDGMLKYYIQGNYDPSFIGCQLNHSMLMIQWDDEHKFPPLLYYKEYIIQNFPGEEHRVEYPFDVRHVTLVRVGNARLTSDFDLHNFSSHLEQAFYKGIKGYFKLIVDNEYHYPLVNETNKDIIKDWYNNDVPKTPDKTVLNLNDPDQLYLAGLCYYSQSNGNDFSKYDTLMSNLKQMYPIQSNNEDITMYLYDSSSPARGQIHGGEALFVRVTQLLPTEVFYKNTNGTITYHFDPTLCTDCDGATTAKEFIKYLATSGSTAQTMSTTLHELGHAYWRNRSGITFQDTSEKISPYLKDDVYRDSSLSFFTRFEYISRSRDVEKLNLTFGDQYLEEILESYAQPETEIKFISHPDNGNNEIYVKPGEIIRFNLTGIANSGLSRIWYGNKSGPVELPYHSPANAGSLAFDPSEDRVKIKTLNARMRLKTPGKYVYHYMARSLLYPVRWHKHQAEIGTFTIIVQ